MFGNINNQLLGVYRAKVVDTHDPMQKGRLRVCPETSLGDTESVWARALISTELAAAGHGDIVLVLFESGNAIHPIVIGLLEKASPDS
jgi:hypothetical protein